MQRLQRWLGKDHAKRNVGDLLRNAKKYNDVLACLDWEWIGVKPEVGEACELLRAVAEWVQRSKIESAIKIAELGMGARKVKSKYRWIERLLTSPVDDGRHRPLWLAIAPYLVNVRKKAIETAKHRALDYLMACNRTRPLLGNLSQLAEYQVEYAKRKRLRPLSFRSSKAKHSDLYEIVKGRNALWNRVRKPRASGLEGTYAQ